MLLTEKFIRKAPKNITLHDFCTGVTKAIRKEYKKSLLPLLQEHPEERLTASAVIFSRVNRQIWMIGDCQCLVNGTLYDNPKPYEDELAEERAAFILKEMDKNPSYTDDGTARKRIIPKMLQAMKEQNVNYAVIDGFPIPEQHIRTITLDFQPWEIVLASDGYPRLEATLEESEGALQTIIQSDPMMIRLHKATKGIKEGNNSFDDRAYIRFKA